MRGSGGDAATAQPSRSMRARSPATAGWSSRTDAPPPTPVLRQLHEVVEESPRPRRIPPVDDVRRVAEEIAGDGDAHLGVRLVRAGTEELRPAGVATARSAATCIDILRDAQVGGVERAELADCEAALAVERVLDPAGSLLRLLRAVADRREERPVQRPGRLHPVEQPASGSSTDVIPLTGWSSTMIAMSCRTSPRCPSGQSTRRRTCSATPSGRPWARSTTRCTSGGACCRSGAGGSSRPLPDDGCRRARRSAFSA